MNLARRDITWAAGVLVCLVVGGILAVSPPERRDDLLARVVARSLNSDREQGGGSMVDWVPTAQGIGFRYGLVRVNDNHPWAGLVLRLAKAEGGPIDLLEGERLEIRARSSRGFPVRLHLISDDAPPPGRERDSTRWIYHALEFKPDGTRAGFNWAAFTVPSWWRVRNSRSDDQRLDLLDRARAIEIQSGDSPSGHDSSVVEIFELQRVGDSRSAKRLGWGLLLLGSAVVAGLVWRKRAERRAAADSRAVGASLVPGPVSLDDPRSRQASQLVGRLGEQFADPELSLERFAAAEGLSPRLVAALIKEATGLHFKGALNELRLGEAARLLKQSKGGISEIGYAVGFQNASHFGRAFREKFGVSPSEYRAKTD